MFKKLLTVTLAAFSFIGLTACGSEKKLTAEEAKAEIKAAQENTAKAIKEGKGFKIDETNKVEATVSAKNIKVDSNLGSIIPEVKSAKLQANLTAKAGLSFDYINLKAKATASEDANVKFNYTAGDSSEKFEVTSKGNGEAYLIKGDSKVNLYASADMDNTFNLPESYKSLIDTDKYGKINKKINIKYDINPDDTDNDINEAIANIQNGTYIEELATFDFNTIITDWTIFSKKGNTISADCSNLSAFGIDAEVQQKLTEIGLTLKISKFEIGLNKNKEITSFDFNTQVKGSIDLSKQNIDTEDIVDLISKFKPEMEQLISQITVNGVTGIVDVDTTLSSNFKVAYTTETITVPDELVNYEETDLMDLIMAILFGNMTTPASQTPAATGE